MVGFFRLQHMYLYNLMNCNILPSYLVHLMGENTTILVLYVPYFQLCNLHFIIASGSGYSDTHNVSIFACKVCNVDSFKVFKFCRYRQCFQGFLLLDLCITDASRVQ